MVITLIIWLCIIAISTVIVIVPQIVSAKIMQAQKQNREDTKAFIVSEYLGRVERANLDILEGQKPADRTIILWWGLDGLKLNEDGSQEWISRRKQEPVNQNVSWQPCQIANINALFYMRQSQSPQAAINALQMQATQQTQNAALIAALQSCCAVPNPQYIQSGMGAVGSGLYTRERQWCGM